MINFGVCLSMMFLLVKTGETLYPG